MLSNSTDRFNGLVASLAIKAPCVAVATSNITLSGEQAVGSVSVVTGDRVLVTAQTDQTENGIYDADTSAWSRAADFDGNRDVAQGSLVVVNNSSGRDFFYQVTTPNPITIGTTAIAFVNTNDPNTTFPITTFETNEGLIATDINDSFPPGDVYRFNVVGDGVVDDTDNLQNAVIGSPFLRIYDGTFLVTGDDKQFGFPTNFARHAIAVPSNRSITIEPTATIKIDTTSAGNYAAFGCYQKTDIEINGFGQIIGDLDTHIDMGGEQGFGIDVRDCDKVRLNNVQVSKCWGDGIYIGGGDPADDATRTTKSEVNHCHSFGNRRQGMSVVGVVDFSVNGGLYETTSGISPQAGIDFEPNSPQRNDRVNINGVHSNGNEIGLLFIRTDNFSVIGGNFNNLQRNIQFDDSKGVVVGASISGIPSQCHFLFNDDTDRKDVSVRGCDIYITTGTCLAQYPGAGGNLTLGDQIFELNTIHFSGAPTTAEMGGNDTTDCKKFVNNTLIFESDFLDTNLTSSSIIIFFKSGWECSGNRIYNRSATNVRFAAGAGVIGLGGPGNIARDGPYTEDLLVNGRGATAFVAADATPSVAEHSFFKTDTGTLTITDFDDGIAGKEITIISKGDVTFDVTATNLRGGTVDIVTATGDVLRWVCEDGTVWRLIGFMDNSVDNSGGA